MSAAELYVTNFDETFTGVSATAAGVVSRQSELYDMRLVGHALPDCPLPISRATGVRMSRWRPRHRPFAIWHVRRNPEMRTALWARDVLRLPIRIVFTSAAQRRHSAFPRWLISRMDAVIATTDAAAGFLPHVRAVIPHGVDTDRFRQPFDRADAWQDLGYPGRRGIATIGCIKPENGTDLFVDAMIKVLPDRPDVTALVIGKASSRDAGFLEGLKARASAAGLSDRILFPGEIHATKMPALMQGLSLLVALPRCKGCGMTALEAMASGVPFVATDTGHFREFSTAQQAGRVVACEDVPGVAAHIAGLLDNNASLAALSQAAVTVAQQCFGIDRELQGITRVYEELWAEGARK